MAQGFGVGRISTACQSVSVRVMGKHVITGKNEVRAKIMKDGCHIIN